MVLMIIDLTKYNENKAGGNKRFGNRLADGRKWAVFRYQLRFHQRTFISFLYLPSALIFQSADVRAESYKTSPSPSRKT